jgi:hypothetical protein
MNKTESRRAVTKQVIELAVSLGYEVSDDGMGGRMDFYHGDARAMDDYIEYQRGNGACCLNWASERTHTDTKAINELHESLMVSYGLA